ncbi:MAG: hypothetical protein RL722_1963 [Pseudomonadota bacterium]|jgi:diguanylate cyclase (GGDEF)-like protein/PAS domain S-box-containing protein
MIQGLPTMPPSPDPSHLPATLPWGSRPHIGPLAEEGRLLMAADDGDPSGPWRRQLDWLVALLVLGLGMLLTWSQAWQTETREAGRQRAELERTAAEVASGLQRRLDANAEILRGVAGLFAASDDVSRSEFRDYLAGLGLDREHPGIQGVGFAQVVPAGELRRHESALRAEGFPDYRVQPAGPREHYTAIVMLEPMDWRNRRAIGFDMASEPVRRAAMEQARDEARAAITTRVTLVQETEKEVQSGFLIYLPVYRRQAPESVEERQQQLRGWAYSPLRAGRLMQAFLRSEHPGFDQHMAVRLWSGPVPREDQLLYDSHPGMPGLGSTQTLRWPLNALQSRWSLELRSLEASAASSATERQTRDVWVIGTMLSLVLAFLTQQLADRSRRLKRALAQARASQRELAGQRDLLRAIHEGSSVAILLLDLDGRIVHANGRLAEMMRLPIDQLIGRDYLSLVDTSAHEDALIRLDRVRRFDDLGDHRIERHYRRPDGSAFWGEAAGRSVRDADGRISGVVVVIEDITQRRADEAQMRHLALHDALTGLPNRAFLIERAQIALELARRRHIGLALLFIDLDRFKPVNDRYGHAAGDALLCALAGRLVASLRASDTVARQGGDEFIVLLGEISKPEALPALAGKLVTAIEAPVDWQGHRLQVSASVGVAIFPEDGEDLDTLIRRADAAMYAAKLRGERICMAEQQTQAGPL